jgi:MFS family permease
MSSSNSPRNCALEPYSEWLDPRFRQLLLFQVAFGYAYAALMLVPKFATLNLGAGPREIGALAACPTLATVVCAPLCGAWLDRGAHRAALIAGTILLGVSVPLFGYLHALGPFAYLLRALHGVGNALVLGGAGAFVARIVPAEHRGRAFGTAGAASLMMNAASSSATERLADAFGWGVAYEVAGGACSFALGVALTQPAVGRKPAASASSSERAVADVRRRFGAGFATLAAGAGFGMLVTFTQPYALARGGSHVASLFVGYTLTALAVRLGFGGAVDRWGPARAGRAALAVYAATVLAAAALRPATLFPLGLGFGFAHGLAWPALCALAVERAAPERAGSALTRVQALFAAGTMLAVWLGGLIVHALGYAAAFVTVGLGVALGALALGELPLAAGENRSRR